MHIALSLPLLLSLLWLNVLAAPPNRWMRYRDKTYIELVGVDSQINTLDYCQISFNSPAHIVNIENIAESSFVATLNGGDRMWISVTKDDTTSNWVDWQGNVTGYTNWASGQPVNNPALTAVYINCIYPPIGKWCNGDPEWESYASVCERYIEPGNAVFVKLDSSLGNEMAIFGKHADRRLDCANLCVQQPDCSCFGYDSVSKNCSAYKWQPAMQSNIDYYCYKDILIY